MRFRTAAALLLAPVAVAAGVATGFTASVDHTASGTHGVAYPRGCEATGTRLRLTVKDEGAAAGTRIFAVTITSASLHTCTLSGFPSVALLGAGDSPITTRDGHHGTMARGVGERTVAIDASKQAAFLITMSGGGLPSPKPACPLVTGLRVKLPGLPARAVPLPPGIVDVHAEPGSPGGRCDDVTVSPLFEGTPSRGMCPACSEGSARQPVRAPLVLPRSRLSNEADESRPRL